MSRHQRNFDASLLPHKDEVPGALTGMRTTTARVIDRAPSWDRFVDVVTVLWIGLFAVDLATSYPGLGTILFWCLPIYVMDLVVKYRRADGPVAFVKQYWFSILMTIPYLRVLRLLRLLRLLRVLRMARVGRVLKTKGIWRKSRRLFRRQWAWRRG